MLYSAHLAEYGESLEDIMSRTCPACNKNTLEDPCSNCGHNLSLKHGDTKCRCRMCDNKRHQGSVPEPTSQANRPPGR